MNLSPSWVSRTRIAQAKQKQGKFFINLLAKNNFSSLFRGKACIETTEKGSLMFSTTFCELLIPEVNKQTFHMHKRANWDFSNHSVFGVC